MTVADRIIDDSGLRILDLRVAGVGPGGHPYHRATVSNGQLAANVHDKFGSWQHELHDGSRRFVLPYVAWALQRAVKRAQLHDEGMGGAVA